ncbi:MAG: radical SAM protein, partial [Candidatus Electrothrix sp. MAN1_4]|nr:radical SAM protein [Candidatus Electrothrix sp. MAN1_4]
FLDLFKYTAPEIDLQKVSGIIRDTEADLYLMSPLLLNHEAAVQIAAVIKKQYGEQRKVVFGGPFATYEGDSLFASPYVDAVYRGRILPDFVEFLESLQNGSDLTGYDSVSWKQNGTIVQNPLGRVESDFLTYDYAVIPESYTNSIPWARLYCSEGCPWACAYCADVIWNRTKPRYLDVQAALDNADTISKRFNVDTFYIGDETFTYDPSFVREFSKGMRSLGLQWFCQTRIDQVDEGLLKDMKKGNCRMVKFGAESSSQQILNTIRKGIQADQVASACRMVKDAGMAAFTYWLAGLPGETETTLHNTIEHVETLLSTGTCDQIEWFICVPYPGTDLYCNPDRYDIRIERKPWKEWREDSPSVLNTAELSAKRIHEIWDEGLGRFAQALTETSTPKQSI